MSPLIPTGQRFDVSILTWSEVLRFKRENLPDCRKLPGVYRQGRMLKGTFVVDRVGRSDTCLRRRLLQYLADPIWHYVGRRRTPLPRFQFAFCSTAQEACEAECWLYHEGSSRLNVIHPNLHAELGGVCPVPNCLRSINIGTLERRFGPDPVRISEWIRSRRNPSSQFRLGHTDTRLVQGVIRELTRSWWG